jgi:hypothetical protein
VATVTIYESEMRHQIIPTKFETSQELIETLWHVAKAAKVSEDSAISQHAEAALQHLIAALRVGITPDLHHDLNGFVERQKARIDSGQSADQLAERQKRWFRLSRTPTTSQTSPP